MDQTATNPEYTIETAMDRFIHKMRDIEDCAQLVPLIVEGQKAKEAELLEELRKDRSIMGERPSKLFGAITKKVFDDIRCAFRLFKSQPERTLRLSLFLGIFSAYDAYLGDLLRALFIARTELFSCIGGDVPLSEVLVSNSTEDLKSGILEKFIENFRRDSYLEQFERLERLFDIKLRQFERWSAFVEASQRRNLMAHADGIVSAQYLQVCKREGVALSESLQSAQRLVVEDEYLRTCCRLVMEVAIKLGHTLWRKLLPNLLAEADKHLRSISYEALELEEWDWAAMLGEFALGQKKFNSELDERVFVVNYAIAIRYKESPESSRRVMENYDWSSCSGEFCLAHAVLNDEYDAASAIMVEIGKKGTMLEGEHSYHTWPLFRDFRGIPQFLKAYNEIYRHEFVTELRKELEQAEMSSPME